MRDETPRDRSDRRGRSLTPEPLGLTFAPPMPSLSPAQYDVLERAIATGGRVAVVRRGIELVVLPLRLRVVAGREAIDARHPSTGDDLTVFLDELDTVEPVNRR